MSLLDPCLIRSRAPSGQVVVRLGVPLADDYLEFLTGRCRPNTVLAYDLRVFFGVVSKPAEEVRPADVLGFITAQRAGRTGGITPSRSLRILSEPCRLERRQCRLPEIDPYARAGEPVFVTRLLVMMAKVVWLPLATSRCGRAPHRGRPPWPKRTRSPGYRLSRVLARRTTVHDPSG